MVRLLQVTEFIAALKLPEFQSHNGAIAASGSLVFKITCRYFQSHNGAIAARKSKLDEWKNKEFQSHNGAIAAKQGLFRPQLSF